MDEDLIITDACFNFDEIEMTTPQPTEDWGTDTDMDKYEKEFSL